MATTMTEVTLVTTINDLPDELLRRISISGDPITYCNFRRASKRLWLTTTGREDHCIKHFLVTKVNSEVGSIETTLCGKMHSMFDQPAVILPDGTKVWIQHNKGHRDNDLPAIICTDGTKMWYQYGKQHRDNDLPAVIDSDGRQEWYQHGKLHRDNDQPAVICPDNILQRWYQHGEPHRDNNLPAFIDCFGTQAWFKHGVPYTP